ncbi:hypothetical protein INT48_006425 [Thamnidium elegans]|uniref:Velvet domain-containing protein n=1 Tax=Thamnidium elegans TaxID=101142 RepID=A0A8H7SH93_9FUNG|nr:hypothetical protein INT48_006425 [Thamnidium elegans]
MSCTYRFMHSSLSELSNDRSYNVILRQQPERAKISIPNERDKRSIEPPPILQLQWINCTEEEEKKSLQSPFYFMVVNIIQVESNDILSSQEYLSGSTVSSLYRLRDIDNTDGGFFVFGDLAVKKQGYFKLQFNLFELIDEKVENRKVVYSNEFWVYTNKLYPGPIESTFLSRTFADQGIKMRIRKNLGHTEELKSDIPSSYKIIPKDIICPPSYASDNVHFGRWQSLPTKSKKLNSTLASPTLLYLPPITSIQQKWLDDDDRYNRCNNRLPPLNEIVNNKKIDSYSPFPIDSSFFK